MTISGHMLRMAAAASQSGFADYAMFLNHITGLAIASATGGQTDFFNFPDGDILITDLGESGSIQGTPWGKYVYAGGTPNRLVQHACPSYALFQSQISNSAAVLLQRMTVPNQTNVVSLNRNNYTSLAYSAAAFPCRSYPRLLYWDFSQNAAFEMNPYAMTGPTPYLG